MELWLEARLSAENWQWLQSRLEILRQPFAARDLHISLGLVPRKLGRADLNLDDKEIENISRSSNLHLDTSDWTVETTARVLMLCTVAERDEDTFSQLFSELCRTADLTESITFYRGVALYPHSAALEKQIGEGLRTNIRAVFEAIAHRNSYPCVYFDQNRWNHMVLKALFIDSTLAPIQGLDERANAELARILCDYAHERWAANRVVTPELWRCVGPFATASMIDDLRCVAQSSAQVERQAGLLALSQCPDSAAHDVLSQFPEDASMIARGELSWTTLSYSLGIIGESPTGIA
ncbi:MAG: EboA domain-containing protein [Granulosicoccus sp.]